MQFILDHMIAIVVAGVLILGLQVTQVRSQHANIEQVASHSVKAKTLVFGEWVERDILDIGANFGTNMYRFEEPDVDSLGNSTRWVFFSDTTAADGQQRRVFKRYRLIQTKMAAFQDTTYQMYQVVRDSVVKDYPAVDVPPATGAIAEADWVKNTWSIGTLSFFQIHLLDRTGETPYEGGVVDVDKVDYIRVRFGVVPEYVLKPDNYMRELYWVKTLKVRPYWVPPPSLD